jgi:hypothetical protein
MGISTRRTASRFQGRIIVHLSDEDAGTVYPHGVVICPPSIETEEQALQAVDSAYRAVVEADPEQWNYDDVIKNLTDAGFEYVSPVYWGESQRQGS